MQNNSMQVKNFIDLLTKGGISAVLLFIVVYFGGNFLTSLESMQRDLASIRVELVKIQSSIITEQHIEKMIDDKLRMMEYKYHSK